MSEASDTPRPGGGPGPETRRLGALVGRWRSEGHVVGEPPVPIEGTDIYEWLPGEFFLVHHVDVVDADAVHLHAVAVSAPACRSRKAINSARHTPAHPPWRRTMSSRLRS
jgi:hypothetical protein